VYKRQSLLRGDGRKRLKCSERGLKGDRDGMAVLNIEKRGLKVLSLSGDL